MSRKIHVAKVFWGNAPSEAQRDQLESQTPEGLRAVNELTLILEEELQANPDLNRASKRFLTTESRLPSSY